MHLGSDLHFDAHMDAMLLPNRTNRTNRKLGTNRAEDPLSIVLHRIAEQKSVETEPPGILLHRGLAFGFAVRGVGSPTDSRAANPGSDAGLIVFDQTELLPNTGGGQEIHHLTHPHPPAQHLKHTGTRQLHLVAQKAAQNARGRPNEATSAH